MNESRNFGRFGSFRVIGRLPVLPILLLSLFLSAVPAQQARAATSCSTANFFFAGRGWDPNTYEPRGAVASISIESADLCNNASNYTDTSAWSMVAGDGAGPKYAQIGYLKHNGINCGCGSVQRRFFYEWSKCAGCDFGQVYFGAPSLGTTHDFKVVRDDTSGHLVMYLNGSTPDCSGSCPFSNCPQNHNQCAETTFDPLNAWSGTNNQWFEESHNLGSDVLGTNSSRTLFSQVRTNKPNGDWVNQTWNSSGSGICYYNVNEITSDSRFEAWTQPLDHSC